MTRAKPITKQQVIDAAKARGLTLDDHSTMDLEEVWFELRRASGVPIKYTPGMQGKAVSPKDAWYDQISELWRAQTKGQ